MNWLTHIQGHLSPDSVQAIHWHLTTDTPVIHTVGLYRKNKQIELGTISKAINPVDLAKQIPKHGAIHLVISGAGVFSKNIEAANERELTQRIAEEIPMYEEEIFHLQLEKTASGYFVSLLRKDLLDNIYRQMGSLKGSVIQVSLGLHQGQLTQGLLGDQVIILFEKKYVYDQAGLLTISSADDAGIPENYQLPDGDQFGHNNLLAFHGALLSLSGQRGGIDPLTATAGRDRNAQYQLLKKTAPLILGFILLMLLLPLILQQPVKKNLRQVAQSLFFHQKKIKEVKTLQGKIHAQDELVLTSGANSQSQVSFYADRLGKTIPPAIALAAMTIYPLSGKEKDYEENDLRKYAPSKIYISGEANKGSDYYEWMNALKKLEWVQETRHLTFKDMEAGSKSFELELLIQIDRK